VLVRFPAVSGKAPGFPRPSRGREWRFRSLLWVTADCEGKMPPRLWLAQTLSRQILSPRTETRSHVDWFETSSHLWPEAFRVQTPPSDGEKLNGNVRHPLGRRTAAEGPAWMVLISPQSTGTCTAPRSLRAPERGIRRLDACRKCHRSNRQSSRRQAALLLEPSSSERDPSSTQP
jgi:hypothetical protein